MLPKISEGVHITDITMNIFGYLPGFNRLRVVSIKAYS